MATVLQLAGMLPRDPDFREFLGAHMVPPRAMSIDEAAECIRIVCQIDSRRELVDNTEAVDRFHKYLRKPFLAWKENHLENA